MSASPPTLTFLFTDIEGSTRRWELQREAMSTALARHDELLAPPIAGNGGVDCPSATPSAPDLSTHSRTKRPPTKTLTN